jgi:hypothetical protein
MRFLILGLLLLLILAAIPLETLFYSERHLALALLHQDRAELAIWIDWPSVRAGLSGDLKARLAGATTDAKDDLAHRIVGQVVNGIAAPAIEEGVERLATPQGLVTLLAQWERFAPAGTTAARIARDPGSIFVTWDHWGRFPAWDRYEFPLEQDGDKPPTRVILRWDAFSGTGWKWRVVRVIPGALPTGSPTGS